MIFNFFKSKEINRFSEKLSEISETFIKKADLHPIKTELEEIKDKLNDIKEENNAYYQNLITGSYESQNSYDKAVLSLSGGALGFSILFLEKLNIQTSSTLLFISWILWGISIIMCFLSLFFATQAFQKSLDNLSNKKTKKIWEDQATKYLNIFGGIFLTAGMIIFLIFISVKLFSNRDYKPKNKGELQMTDTKKNKAFTTSSTNKKISKEIIEEHGLRIPPPIKDSNSDNSKDKSEKDK